MDSTETPTETQMRLRLATNWVVVALYAWLLSSALWRLSWWLVDPDLAGFLWAALGYGLPVVLLLGLRTFAARSILRAEGPEALTEFYAREARSGFPARQRLRAEQMRTWLLDRRARGMTTPFDQEEERP